jgi:hypothetical protein
MAEVVHSSEQQSPAKRVKQQRLLLVLAGILVFAVAMWLVGSALVSFFVREYRKATADRLLRGMRDRGDHAITLYDTDGTDEILGHLRNTDDLQNLTLYLTDVTEEGMHLVATLPKLRRLELSGGHPGIDDNGLIRLQGKTGLEELILKNTPVTNEGLAVLKELPDLKRLSLVYNAVGPSRLSDAALTHMLSLLKLEELRIVGHWASDSAIQSLRMKMPGCTILQLEADQP